MENLPKKTQKVDEYGLNSRERRFADEYIANGNNKTAAYRTISPNAKDLTCSTQGSVYAKRPHVAEYIRIKTIERLDASNLKAENVLDELIKIGFGRVQKGINRQKDNSTGEVIKDLEYETTAITEDRLKALELIGKNLAMWTDKTELNASVSSVTIIDDVGDDDDDDDSDA